MIRITDEEKRRVLAGDVRLLSVVLDRELGNVKNELVDKYYGQEVDASLKGRGQLIKELLKLLPER